VRSGLKFDSASRPPFRGPASCSLHIFIPGDATGCHSQQPPERSVLSHAASAWWGFTIADDRQRLEADIRRGIRSGFRSADQSDFFANIFYNIFGNTERVLNSVLPSSIQLIYELRPKRHNRSLITKVNTMNESDFVFILLYKDKY